jgi:hypothetical protein
MQQAAAMAKTIYPGTSIESSTNDGAGTLGCFVKTKDGSFALLTSSHVVITGFVIPQNLSIYTPVYQTSSCFSHGDVIATLQFDPNQIDTNGKYFGGFTSSTKSTTDCALALINSGVPFDNTCQLTSGTVAINGAEPNVTKLLGSSLLVARQGPAQDHYVRIISTNHPGQAIWGTVMWTTTTQGVDGGDQITLGGQTVTPIQTRAITDGKDGVVGAVTNVNQFFVLPRPPDPNHAADYTTLYNQTWLNDVIGGDSGAIVLNSLNQVVGLVARAQPFSKSMIGPADQSAIEYQNVKSFAVCNPIRDVIARLSITIPNAPFAGTGAFTPQASRGHTISFAHDPAAVALAAGANELRAALRARRHGKLVLGLIARHRVELQRMFRLVRAIAATWRNLDGPAWAHHVARSLREPAHVIPDVINGVTRDRLVDGLLPLVAAHASPALHRDLARHGAWARNALLYLPTTRASIGAM